MGDLFGSVPTHDQINFQSTQNVDSSDVGKVETDVSGVFADGKKDGLPVFNVSKEDFYNNMRMDRKRMRFKTDTVSQYLRGTRYNRPFYIEYKGDKGEHYLRKIK